MTDPRIRDPHFCDEPDIQRALRVALIALFVAAMAIAAFTLLIGWRLTPLYCLAAAASCLPPLVISRYGPMRQTMLVPMLGITYVVLYLASKNEGIHNVGLTMLPVLIMVGCIVLERVPLILFVVVLNLAVCGMLAIRYFVTRREQFSINDVGDWFVFVVTCVTATVVGRLLAVRIEESFRRIRDSEKRYRGIFENVHDVYYEMQTGGALLEVSPASAELIGLPREELIGRRLASFCENPADLEALLAEVRGHGRVSNREMVIRDRSAALHDVLVNATLQSDPKTGEARVIGSIRDITERRRSAEAVREWERKFRELLEGVQLVAIITNLDGRITFCNDYTLAITGWTKEELIGHPANQLLSPELVHRGADRNDLAPPLEDGSILGKNGHRRSIQWSSMPIRDASGHVAGFARLGEDGPEIRALRTEESPHETEDHFREVANTAPLLIWTSGADHACTFVNKAWTAFTGRTLEQAVGSGWTADIHPDYRDQCLATVAAAHAERRNFSMEYRRKRADGEYRWVLGSGMPRFLSDGEFIGYVGTLYDITDLKHRHEEDLARQKWESLGTLAGGIAHDFNNLLGGVLSQSELALAELADGGSADAEIRSIQSVAIRGAQIVRQLMTYAGHREEPSELVNVSRIVEDSRALLRVVVSKHSPLEFHLAEDLWEVRANASTVRQILINLVTNASEAIGEHDGVIRVSTMNASIQPHWPFYVGGLPAGDYVQLEVTDTGCGIPHESQARIFDPFFTTKSAGRGLGLAVSQGIVRRLGGVITVNSSPAGSVFRVLLPGAAPVEYEGYGAEEKRAANGGTVLIVEDEDLLREAVSGLLKRRGFTVLEARDGPEAFRMLRNHAGELTTMLLDVNVPGAPSPEIFREAQRLCRSVRIIVTSARGEAAVAPMFTGLGPFRFLPKPMQIAEFLKLLSEA